MTGFVRLRGHLLQNLENLREEFPQLAAQWTMASQREKLSHEKLVDGVHRRCQRRQLLLSQEVMRLSSRRTCLTLEGGCGVEGDGDDAK